MLQGPTNKYSQYEKRFFSKSGTECNKVLKRISDRTVTKINNHTISSMKPVNACTNESPVVFPQIFNWREIFNSLNEPSTIRKEDKEEKENSPHTSKKIFFSQLTTDYRDIAGMIQSESGCVAGTDPACWTHTFLSH